MAITFGQNTPDLTSAQVAQQQGWTQQTDPDSGQTYWIMPDGEGGYSRVQGDPDTGQQILPSAQTASQYGLLSSAPMWQPGPTGQYGASEQGFTQAPQAVGQILQQAAQQAGISDFDFSNAIQAAQQANPNLYITQGVDGPTGVPANPYDIASAILKQSGNPQLASAANFTPAQLNAGAQAVSQWNSAKDAYQGSQKSTALTDFLTPIGIIGGAALTAGLLSGALGAGAGAVGDLGGAAGGTGLTLGGGGLGFNTAAATGLGFGAAPAAGLTVGDLGAVGAAGAAGAGATLGGGAAGGTGLTLGGGGAGLVAPSTTALTPSVLGDAGAVGGTAGGTGLTLGGGTQAAGGLGFDTTANAGLGLGNTATTLAPELSAVGASTGGLNLPTGLTNILGNAAGSAVSAIGANSAANTIANAANTAANDQQNIFNQQLALEQPFITAGQNALPALTAGAAPGGQFNKPYTLADFQSGPQSGLYNFANNQAQEALKNSMQAGGQNLSSNSAIGAGTLAGNLANQYYNTGFNENQASNTMALNTLQGLAGEGQSSVGAVSSDLNTLGTTQGNAALTAGNANAAATQSTANTIGSLLSNTLKDSSTMSYLSSLFS